MKEVYRPLVLIVSKANVRCILKRYCAREELKPSENDENVEKQFEVAILALGEVAWKCLLNGRLSFYGRKDGWKEAMRKLWPIDSALFTRRKV